MCLKYWNILKITSKCIMCVFKILVSMQPCDFFHFYPWKNRFFQVSVIFSTFISYWIFISSVLSSVMSNSLWPRELQHARATCRLLTPRVHSNSYPSSLWCHQAISSSVVPFSYYPQSLPGSESFPMSQLFAWGGQSIGVSALASVNSGNSVRYYFGGFQSHCRWWLQPWN